MPFFIIALLLVASCQSTKPSVETLELQARQNRLYDVSDPARFHKAAVKVLLAQGYSLRTKDDARGLIVAVAQRSDRANTILERIPGQSRLLKGELVEFTVAYSLEKQNVRARTSLQRLAPYTLGGHEGVEVLDKSVYDGFFDAIMAELRDVGQQSDRNFVPAAVSIAPGATPTPSPSASPTPSPTPSVSPTPIPSVVPKAPPASQKGKPTEKATPEPSSSAVPSVENSPSPSVSP